MPQVGFSMPTNCAQSASSCPVRLDLTCVTVDSGDPQYAYPLIYLNAQGVVTTTIYISVDGEALEGLIEKSTDCSCS